MIVVVMMIVVVVVLVEPMTWGSCTHKMWQRYVIDTTTIMMMMWMWIPVVSVPP